MIRPLTVGLGAGTVVGALLLSACGGDAGGEPTDDAASAQVTVFAAASLAEAFTALAEAFEAEVPDTSVTLSFAASSELVAQIDEGAPADVYASADEENMAKLTERDGTVDEPEVFATNRLQIIVEPGNPLGIETVDDLADPEVLFVTAAPEVPIGRYTLEVLAAAGVEATPRSLEDSVRGVASKVELGEADAGIVFATEVLAAGDRAEGVDLPPDLDIAARYPIAVPESAPNPEAAQAFVDFVLSEPGQEMLAAHGFAGP